jgi:hypothetical protein
MNSHSVNNLQKNLAAYKAEKLLKYFSTADSLTPKHGFLHFVGFTADSLTPKHSFLHFVGLFICLPNFIHIL